MNQQQVKQNMVRTIILDACALKSQEAIEIIENAEKVIVLTGTIRELDKHKELEGAQGRSIRYIGKKIRQDTESKKYVCISKYEKYRYNDDNIIDYCNWHNDVTILTCDNYLCAKAKAHGIPYIFPKISEECKNNGKHTEVNEKRKHSKCNVKGVTYKNDKLLILSETLKDPNFNVIIIRYGKVIKFSLQRNMELKVGDTIIRIKESNEKVTLAMFEVTNIKSKDYAEHIEAVSLEKPITKSLKEANLPTEVKKEISFLLNGENYEENIQEEICLENRKIYVKQGSHNTYIWVDRNGTLIKRQDYMEGDIIYFTKTNKKKKSLTLYVYRIIKKLNIYTVEKIEEHSIKSINDIYLLDCSEKLKDKIRDFYIRNIRY